MSFEDREPPPTQTAHSVSYSDHRIRLLLKSEKQQRLDYDAYKEKYKNNMELAFGKDEDGENKAYRKELDKEREKKLAQGLNQKDLRKKLKKSKRSKKKKKRSKEKKRKKRKSRSRRRYDSDYSDDVDSYSSTSHSSDYKKDRGRKKRRKHRKYENKNERSRSRSREKRKRKKKDRKRRKEDNTLGANHPFNKNISKAKMSNFMKNRRGDSSSDDDSY